jgi:predicted RNase H-like HicB family nuclease
MAMVTPAEGLPTQWSAHVLDFDVVTQGDSPTHAAQMAYEAAMMVALDDLNEGRDPHGRRAPQKFWARLYTALNGGEHVDARTVNATDRSKAYVFFLELHVERGDDDAVPRSMRQTAPVAWASEQQACA